MRHISVQNREDPCPHGGEILEESERQSTINIINELCTILEVGKYCREKKKEKETVD